MLLDDYNIFSMEFKVLKTGITGRLAFLADYSEKARLILEALMDSNCATKTILMSFALQTVLMSFVLAISLKSMV